MDLPIQNLVPDPDFAVGIVLAEGVQAAPSPEPLAALISELVARRAAEEFPPAPVKEAVRQLLKRGGFKPSGRNKPASEYLAQAAREGRFPRINNLVDVNNLLSLETGLPISLLDLAAFSGRVELRYGRAGEKYVFNNSGQEIELEGLICACGAAPLGNPVKDSMAGKLQAGTSSVIGIIYASRVCADGRGLAAHVARFAELLERFAAAGKARTMVLPPA